MNPVYLTPTFNSKPCFLFYTVFKQGNSYCDPTCGPDGTCYSQSHLHIGGESGQAVCDNDSCTLHNFWLFASKLTTQQTNYEYFRVRWFSNSPDRNNRQIYMGENDRKFMWLSPYYFGIIDATTTSASLLFEPSTQKMRFFSNATSTNGSISFKDTVDIISNSTKSGLEFWKNDKNTAKLQAQASGGILEMKDANASSTTTKVWASDDNAGLSVESTLTADIQFNTSVLMGSTVGASSSDLMTFRNLGTTLRKFIIASTSDTPSFNGPIYINDKKFVRKSFSVCVEGVTKTIEFLAHEPGVDI